jgi:hypothetical protein
MKKIKKINSIRRRPMKVKELIKVLQEYNLNAEVMIVTKRNRAMSAPLPLLVKSTRGPEYLGLPQHLYRKK